MSVLPEFHHLRPETLDEALGLISFDSPAYCGGTELLLAMRAGLLRPDRLIDLKGIKPLARVAATESHLEIGGSATHQSVSDAPAIRTRIPELTATLVKVGNPRVRAAGTLGGNLCFAEPKSDVATILMALEADVELRSSSARRTVPVSELIVGPYTTVREENELLTKIRIPDRGDRPVSYVKYQTMERPSVGVAAAVTSEGRCRVVVGAVGGMPEMFEASEPEGIDPEEMASTVEVIPDLTGSDRYKRHLVRLHVQRALSALER